MREMSFYMSTNCLLRNLDKMRQYHAVSKKTHVIVKLKMQQGYNIIVHRSKLKGKNDHLKGIGFKDAVFITKSMKLFFFFVFELGFSPCKAEMPLQDMELLEKEAQKD